MADTEDPQPLGELVTQFADRFPHLADTFQAGVDAGLPQGRQAVEEPEQRAEREQQRREFYLDRWEVMVPAMYAQASLSDLGPAQGHAWPDGSLNLCLAGAVGTGKTHAAYAWGNHLAARGLWVAAATTHDLLDSLRPDGDRRLAHGVRACHVLIVDDLGATTVTPWAVDTLTALLDARLRDERRTIVTTNATEDQLVETWGGRLVDRLRYRRTVHVYTGESRRKAAW